MDYLEGINLNLFNLESDADNNKLQAIKSPITAYCYNAVQKIFCDSLGWAHVCYKNWDFVSFQASFCAIKLCSVTEENNILATLTHDEASNSQFLQIFNLQKLTRRDGAPCLGSKRLKTMSRATTIGVCFMDTQICVAVGLDKGEILIHRGSINRDISFNFSSLMTSARIISGIVFKKRFSSMYNLFISSDCGVLCYTVTENNAINETKVVLDSNNDRSTCCALRTRTTEESYFVVGRDDAVYCFTPDGRGPCYAIDGRKEFVAWFGNNLLVVMQQQKKSFLLQTTSIVIVIDVHSKMLVFSKEIGPIMSVIVQDSNCFLVTKSKEVFLLSEKDIQSKVRLLTDKNLYENAIRLLEETEYINQNVGEIYLKYGDHLLAKGDNAAATDMYIKTIGLVQPYNVIRKLLNSQYNKYLAIYLRALVQTEYATDDHLELLLNCSERLDLPAKVESICVDKNVEFGSQYCSIVKSTNEEKRGVIQDISLSTFLRHIHDKDETIGFFKNLDEEKIIEFFMENGHRLVTCHAQELIEILKALCTKDCVTGNCLVQHPERFIPILMTDTKTCISFLEYVISQNENCSKTIYNSLFELYLRTWCQSDEHAEIIGKFLKAYASNVCGKHIFILCKKYSFWTGLEQLPERFLQDRACLQYISKTPNMRHSVQDIEHYFNINPFLWLQNLNNEDLKSVDSVNLMAYLFDSMVKDKHQSPMQILQNVFKNKLACVSHIKSLFTNENINSINHSDHKVSTQLLCDDKRNIKDLLSKYEFNPIEFRNSTCDKCKRQLRFPAVYFLCQHSFHKECISAYSGNDKCVACIGSRKAGVYAFIETEKDFNKLIHSNDIMEAVSLTLSSGVFQQLANPNHTINDIKYLDNEMLPIGTISIKTKKPNFPPSAVNSNRGANIATSVRNKGYLNRGQEYDSNLNPFDV